MLILIDYIKACRWDSPSPTYEFEEILMEVTNMISIGFIYLTDTLGFYYIRNTLSINPSVKGKLNRIYNILIEFL